MSNCKVIRANANQEDEAMNIYKGGGRLAKPDSFTYLEVNIIIIIIIQLPYPQGRRQSWLATPLYFRLSAATELQTFFLQSFSPIHPYIFV